MNIWQVYLVGIVFPLFWAIFDFVKIRKSITGKGYYHKNPSKKAFVLSLKNYIGNVTAVISVFATIYVVGYILALAFVDAIPYF